MATLIGSKPTPNVERAMERQRGCFQETVQDGLIDLTRAFTYSMFDGNGKANSSLFVHEGLFLGGIFDDIRGGAEAYERFCDTLASLDLRIVFTNQSFAVHPFGPNECLVVFSSHLIMSERGDQSSMVSEPLRIVFNWLLVGDLPRVQYLELSFPLSRRSATDLSSGRSGVGTDFDLVDSESTLDERLLEVHDMNRKLVFLGFDEILCVEARGRKSHLLLREGSIDVSESIGQIEEQVSSENAGALPFIRIHRSYLVNAWHLRSLTAESAELDDGTVVSVSARRVPEVRAQLKNLHRPHSLPLNEFAQIVRSAH